ncbi:MAG: hypothetical protein WCP53_05270 [Verrucomicrobiota bacterium]
MEDARGRGPDADIHVRGGRWSASASSTLVTRVPAKWALVIASSRWASSSDRSVASRSANTPVAVSANDGVRAGAERRAENGAVERRTAEAG